LSKKASSPLSLSGSIFAGDAWTGLRRPESRVYGCVLGQVGDQDDACGARLGLDLTAAHHVVERFSDRRAGSLRRNLQRLQLGQQRRQETFLVLVLQLLWIAEEPAALAPIRRLAGRVVSLETRLHHGSEREHVQALLLFHVVVENAQHMCLETVRLVRIPHVRLVDHDDRLAMLFASHTQRFWVSHLVEHQLDDDCQSADQNGGAQHDPGVSRRGRSRHVSSPVG
jgi:hypothetical protein